jgi:hypothetical protein
MKPRTKEENAAHSRAQREKKRLAAVSPARVSPRITSTVSPAPPISGVCPNCEAQAAEIAHLGDLVLTLLAKVATLEADINGSSTTAHQVTPKGDNAEALRQRVIAEKTNRINTFGRNPVIGSARL